MVLLAGPALAQTHWDGGDDLPVNPLSCDGGGAVLPRPYAYDGDSRRARPISRASRSRWSTCPS